jgi:hypothetical protein
VLAQGFGESEKKSTPYFFLDVMPTAKWDGQQWINGEYKYSRTIKLYVTDKTEKAIVEKITGIYPEWGRTFRELDPDHPGFHSLVDLEVVCENEPQANAEGKVYDNFDLPWAAPEFVATENVATVATRLDTLLGKGKPAPAAKPAKAPAKAHGKKAAPAKQTVSAGESGGPEVDDDDIPF